MRPVAALHGGFYTREFCAALDLHRGRQGQLDLEKGVDLGFELEDL